MKSVKCAFRTPSFLSVSFFPSKGLLSTHRLYAHSTCCVWKHAFLKGYDKLTYFNMWIMGRIFITLCRREVFGFDLNKGQILLKWQICSVEFIQESVDNWERYFEGKGFILLRKKKLNAMYKYHVKQQSEITSHKQSPTLLM